MRHWKWWDGAMKLLEMGLRGNIYIVDIWGVIPSKWLGFTVVNDYRLI